MIRIKYQQFCFMLAFPKTISHFSLDFRSGGHGNTTFVSREIRLFVELVLDPLNPVERLAPFLRNL